MEVFNKPNYLKITNELWESICLTDRPGLITKYRDFDTEEIERQAVEEVLLLRKILEKRVYTEEPKEEINDLTDINVGKMITEPIKEIEQEVIADFSEAQAFLDEMSDRGYLPLGDTGQFIGVNEFKVYNPSISTTRKKNSEDPITDREQYFKHIVGAIARFKPHRSKETIELPVSSFVFDKRALRFYTVMIDRTKKPNGRYKLYHKRSSEVEII